ncbi:hypothetical protein B5K08_23965 [Rhizobium leguminosarum bv. trifolii]|uniref:Aldehyde oxidase/xanthine dehydrogenase first molybdopterin binding domain-containing protein n=1 Tax=Rhizobium leguminosarum bv. trifolii TaxID=386 RepID=A0A3E1B6S5_RHILT|nr:hypothetical protein B5K08_23965 [Rhizobium leguminosarum bv. trifolii]RFB86638.1 hypothetical protein B5K10_23950 [Rhizobium leguminosarum bv. trifolii]
MCFRAASASQETRMRVVAPDVGGSFGGKGSFYGEEILVCALARKLKRPIKFISDRLKDLSATSQAFDELIEAELAVSSIPKQICRIISAAFAAWAKAARSARRRRSQAPSRTRFLTSACR